MSESKEDLRRKIAPHTRAHNDMVAYLMNAARGDLILDRQGNLCTRNIWNLVDYSELPFDQHTSCDLLARISAEGWILTPDGAQFILENCPPESQRKINYLTKLIRS
jgi:hypothetical protein